MLNDITRCLGTNCHQRLHCARHTALGFVREELARWGNNTSRSN